MSMKRLALTALLAVCFTLSAAMAQEGLGRKNELSGLIGRTFISDQGITSGAFAGSKLTSGNGTSIEINYARRVISGGLLSVSAEVPFVLNPDEDYHTPVTLAGDYRSYFVTPAARLNLFSGQAVSPWVSVGGGFGHFSATSIKTSNTVGIFQAGLGLDVKVLGRFSIRGAVRDFWSGVPELNVDTGKTRQHNFLVAAGVVVHF
jgi:opacity protein-like surface antigen